MADRYFSESPITTDRVLLTGPEAHHLIHVMRAKAGTRVTLFDGGECEFSAVVERLGRSEVALSVFARDEVDRELPLELTLGVALPKGERQKWLVEKAVELGVARIVPLETARAVAQPVAQAVARLRRAVIEASKQCGRNRLMTIAEPLPWPVFVKATEETECRLLAHPYRPMPCANREGTTGAPREGRQGVALAIGPEGGFTEDEVSLALAAGWHRMDLGSRILRVETAAIALVAAVVLRGPDLSIKVCPRDPCITDFDATHVKS